MKPKGKLAKRLREHGSAKMKAKVKLAPADGLADKESKRLKLKRKRR